MMQGPAQAIAKVQDRLAGLLGTTVEGRPRLVSTMLHRNPSEATSYWLQLVVSVGIATLGLVVGSAAVVIGAMLVAPLMIPIVALAMGLATGSPFLVLRSAARILLSVLAAISGAALITYLLPFHELNSEIAARTAPTVLDLVTAAFCALAGVYASLRPGSETATTAAGTSIGISLVPPLCASGYGLGTSNWLVAAGAAMLFLTNLVAIVAVGTVTFLTAGFNRVDVAALERAELDGNGGARVSRAVARRLAGLFESRFGPALRFLMPLALLAAVYVPLRRALDEVAWEVRVRAAVRSALSREGSRIVQSSVHVERREIDLTAVIVGSAAEATEVEARIAGEVRPVAGVVPRVKVLAVPDATAFAGLESALRAPRVSLLPMAPAIEAPGARLEGALAAVRNEVSRFWPPSAGDVLSVEMAADHDGVLLVRLVHLGPPLEVQMRETLEKMLQANLEREARVEGVAIPAHELGREQGDLELVARVAAALEAGAAVPNLAVCVTRPELTQVELPDREKSAALSNTLDGLLGEYPNVRFVLGEDFRIRFVLGECPVAITQGASAPSATGSGNETRPPSP